MEKKRRYFSKSKGYKNPLEELTDERYQDLLEEGYSDCEIAREFDIDDSYFRRLKDGWREDF